MMPGNDGVPNVGEGNIGFKIDSGGGDVIKWVCQIVCVIVYCVKRSQTAY